MEAVLSDKECGYYIKLITFILGIGMDVLHTYFEQNILNAKEHLEFYMFLDKNKHNLYHECYPKVECCECSQNGLGMASQKGCLTKQQFMLLFEIGALTEIDHYQTGRRINEISKQCLCRIIAKRSNDVDCMDITLMYAIIQSCYLKHNIAIHGNPRCIEAIKDTRNFLAHVPNPRISKSEFDTRFAETEQALLEIGSSLGKYFAKVNQNNIDKFKRNDLSVEGIKGIIENNIDDIIKKKLQTFIEDQRTNVGIIKDEISEQLAKYKEEMKIEIRNLIFEVKQDAVAPYAIEKTFDSPVPQKNATACGANVEETEEGNINVKKRRVEWKLLTPSTWNLPDIIDTLKRRSARLRQYFEIENVFEGSLVIQTLVQQNVLDNREEFRASVHLFLEKFVEVCRINADVPTVIKVALIIELGEFEKEETEEQPSNIEINKKDKTTYIADNTSFDCQNYRQKDEIIASLKEELSAVFIKALKETTCFEGKTVILQCIVSGSKCIAEWLKNDEEVLYGEKVRQECLTDVIDGIHVQVYKLIISESTNEDSGTYTLKLGSKTSSCVLSVTERIPSLIKLRKYQEELAEIAVTGQNTIICVGTNAGKTYVAYHIIEDHLTKYPEGKVVFINKTNVLLEQQYSRACKVFKDLNFQGKIYKWDASLEDECEPFPSIVQRVTLFFCTPKSLCNHLDEKSKNKIPMDLFTLIVLDECHHVIRRNPFNEIMNYYRRQKFESESSMIPQVLGLTASPGTNRADDEFSAVQQLKCLMANMDVSKLSVVRKYEQELLNYSSTPTKVKIRSTERQHDPVKGILLKAIKNVESVFTNRKVTSFLMQDSIETRTLLYALESPPSDKRVTSYVQWISETKRKTESVMLKDADVPRLIHICLRHLELYVECLEMNSLLEKENVTELLTDAYGLFSYECQQSSTIQERQIIEALKDVTTRLREIRHSAESNPDVHEIIKTLLQEYEILNDDSRFLVFVKTRASAKALAKRLPDCLKATHLTGGTKSKDKAGLHIDEQLEVMGRFREGEHLCIVALPVACEGLDIPQCNLMIRYKFRVDEISSYQMRGRIRDKEGREVILASSEDFERETKNILRQYYMKIAIEQVIDLDLTAHIAIAERGIYASEVQGRLLQQRQADSKTIGAFTVNCKFCGKPVADGQFIRNIKKKITIIFDKTILTRIRREPLKKITKFDTIKKTERVFGNICGHNWGVILVYQQCEFVAISKDKVNFFDKFSKELVKFKKWPEFPYRIDEVSDEEVQRYLSQ